MLLALLVAASAQNPAQLPLFADPRIAEALGGFDARAGAWAEYAIVPRNGAGARLRVSVLGPARADGRYWLEAASQAQGTAPVAFRMLLRGPPGPIDNVERLYVYVAGQAPTEFPLDAQARRHAVPPRGAVPPVKKRGIEPVRVAAGHFDAELLEVRRTRIWRSREVPLWGLVRAVDRSRRVELVRYGRTGAESVFPPEFDQGNGSERKK